MPNGRVFVIESPNPLDLLENRGERDALLQVCRLAGHDTFAFIVRDIHEFKQTCDYVSSIKGDKSDKTPLYLHISLHGDESGIGVGSEHLEWKELAAILQSMYNKLRYYHGPIILILSACGTNKQRLTIELSRLARSPLPQFTPPDYVFVFGQESVTWADAVVAWTIFYHAVTKIDFFDQKKKVQALLDRIARSGFGNLRYSRWDSSLRKYKVLPQVRMSYGSVE